MENKQQLRVGARREGAAVDEAYDRVISEASALLASALIDAGDVLADALSVDLVVRDLLRAVAKQVVERVLAVAAANVVEAARRDGMTFERRQNIQIRSLFGMVTVASPHMVNRTSKTRARPVRSELGLHGRMATPAVERALADFGAEESCALAARRFAEHYGQDVGRTSVLRVLKRVATEAE